MSLIPVITVNTRDNMLQYEQREVALETYAAELIRQAAARVEFGKLEDGVYMLDKRYFLHIDHGFITLERTTLRELLNVTGNYSWQEQGKEYIVRTWRLHDFFFTGAL